MYLEEKYSNDSNRLLPSDPVARAAVFQKMFESANITTNITVTLVYYRWRTKKEDIDEKLLEENTEKAKVELGFWDQVILR